MRGVQKKMPGSNVDSATLAFMYSVLKQTSLSKINSNVRLCVVVCNCNGMIII